MAVRTLVIPEIILIFLVGPLSNYLGSCMETFFNEGKDDIMIIANGSHIPTKKTIVFAQEKKLVFALDGANFY
jgi:hypothetical protein